MIKTDVTIQIHSSIEEFEKIEPKDRILVTRMANVLRDHGFKVDISFAYPPYPVRESVAFTPEEVLIGEEFMKHHFGR